MKENQMKEVEIDNNINKNKEKERKVPFYCWLLWKTYTHTFSFQLFFSCFIVVVVDKGKLFFSVSKVDVYQLKKRKANNKKNY